MHIVYVKNVDYNVIKWCISNFAQFEDTNYLVFYMHKNQLDNPRVRWGWDDNHLYFRYDEDYIQYMLTFN